MHHLKILPHHILAPPLLVFSVVMCSFLLPAVVMAQNSTPRNLDLLDSAMRSAAQGIAKQLYTPLFPQDTLHIIIVPHEASWMLENAIFATLRKAKRYRTVDSAAVHTKLTIRLSDCTIRYFSYKDKFDMLEREASCGLVAYIETRDGIVQPLETVTRQMRDTIARQAVASLESKQYVFAAPTVPDATPNFWKQVIEPAVVILAGVLIVALFFFVRTQ